MSNLTEHAKRQLQLAGWFDQDTDQVYGGLVGPAVMELVEKLAEQGHSGYSIGLVMQLFGIVGRYGFLVPIENPKITGRFHDVSEPSGTPPLTTLQALEGSGSIFSEDGGERWYDIDKELSWFSCKILRQRRAYITFPYLPKAS